MGQNFIEQIRDIVADAEALRRKHSPENFGNVGYCCIFCQSDEEYSNLDGQAKATGRIAKETETGRVYIVDPIHTAAGDLRIIKIRLPDSTRTERGDADFSIARYFEFKESALKWPGFKLIERPENEMLELMNKDYDVRVYFSHPPVEEHSGIKDIL